MRALRFGLGLTRLPIAAVPFTPAVLFPASGAWYDPSDFSTMFQDTAGTTPVTATTQQVKLLNDKSGNGHNLTSGATGPTLQQDASGRYYLSFNGTSAYLRSVGWTAMTQPFDRVSAIQQDTWATSRYIYDGGTGDTLILYQNTITPNLRTYAGTLSTENSAGTLGVPQYVAERFNGASSSFTIGSTVVNGNWGAGGTSGIIIGARATSLASFCPVKFFGMVLRAGTLSAAQLTSLHTYLSTKSGAA